MPTKKVVPVKNNFGPHATKARARALAKAKTTRAKLTKKKAVKPKTIPKSKAKANKKTKVVASRFGVEEKADHYDRVYASSKVYCKTPEELEGTAFYNLWKHATEKCKADNCLNIVDIGCGPGHFPKLLQSTHKNIQNYWGYDFSETSLKMARELLGNDARFKFIKADVTKTQVSAEKPANATYCSFEFLEHVNDDIKVIESIPSGAVFHFSVPNFWTKGHVRIFENNNSIHERYGGLLNNIQITQLLLTKTENPRVHYFCTAVRK